ncbi:UNVERIFIED_CONTAM: F-box/LRR-repeat protein 14 [Sesamum radiatum]|uniref:F-box/LRR-repeat protein 14 n=1 Tax=Sesamum radiatum TaxID=300843 RepID=A0AAW2PG21_SESRA
MDNLPEQVAWDILGRIKRTVDKNSVSLTCKRLHELDNEQRKCIRVGCGLNPANEALVSLCNRFQNLEKVEISYSGWMSKLGKQLDDRGLYNLSVSCPLLTDLTLSYCTFITDAGLSHLASCSHLSALKLIFTPRISGFGILSVVVGCKNLNLLHLNRCLNITSMEWLEYLGKLQTLEDLCIKNCRAIGEGLRPLAVDQWQTQWIPCDSMIELKLVNGIISPGRGLARNSSNLRSISLRVPSDFSLPLLMNNPIRLTDECLEALAQNCSHLESVRLSFSDGEFPSFSSFTLRGILTLVQNCPIRELALDHVYSFNDVGMEALCSAENLQMLELSRCQEITDEGLQLVAQFPKLCVLKLSKCLGVTNDGLKPLVGSHKLKLLAVDDCPQISERGVHGAADSVTFKQDLSWMY